MASLFDHSKRIGTILGRLAGTIVKTSATYTGTAAKAGGRALGKAGKAVAKKVKEKRAAAPTKARPKKRTPRPGPGQTGTSPSSPNHPYTHAKVTRRPKGNRTTVFDIRLNGLPEFTYAPEPNGNADPGEVVWTWIPYADDPTIGKDRPVVVLGTHGRWLVVAQMTSKNHDIDRTQENRAGRYWLDIGRGPWDSKQRESTVRLDRLLQVLPGDVRREGARIPFETYEKVVEALVTFHGEHL